MRLRHITFALFVAYIACIGALSSVQVSAQPTQSEIRLLEPISGGDTLSVQPGAGTVIEYFNRAANWLLLVSVGFCVIWVVIGGIEIMISAGGPLREQGKGHIQWSITGIVMLLFAGFILRTLNSMFFQ